MKLYINKISLCFVFMILFITILYNLSSSSFAINKKYQSTLLMLSSEQKEQMLSSIISIENKIIVIDGGWTHDADKLYSTVKQYGNKIDAWLLTHPDPDHAGALYQILYDKKYNNESKYKDLEISAIYCSLAEDEWYQTYASPIADFVIDLKYLLKEQNVVTVDKDDIIKLNNINNVKIYVLNDRYDLHKNEFEVINNSSIVYRVVIGSTSILYLGDLGFEGGEKLLAETSSNLLCSDIVQMAHHGQSGVGEDVYQAINPKIALWPTPDWLWTNYNGTSNFKTMETIKWMEKIGSVNYITAYGDIVLELK